MAKKAFKPLHIAPLQRVIAEEITDPAEQAALDKMRRSEKRRLARVEAFANAELLRAARAKKAKRKA